MYCFNYFRGISGVEIDIGLNRVTQDQIDNRTEGTCSSLEECTNSVPKLSHENTMCEEDYKKIVSNDRLKPSKKSCHKKCADSSSVNISEWVSSVDRDASECNASFCEESEKNHINKKICSETHEPIIVECVETSHINQTSITGNEKINLLESMIETKSENKDKLKLSEKNEIIQNERNESGQEIDSYSENISENRNHIKKVQTKNGTKTKTRMKKESQNKKGFSEDAEQVNTVIKVERSIREWMTIDSLCFIYSDDKVKELLADKGKCIKELHNICGNAMTDPYLYERYLAICRKLNVLEVEDSRVDSDITNENNKIPQKPLPDYSLLVEESKNIELKVKQFYKGDSKVTFQEAAVKDTENIENSRAIVLPLVDLHAQRSLRRRIVLDKLSKV